MNEVRKDVTDYDTSDRKKRKFFIYVWFQRFDKNPRWSVLTLSWWNASPIVPDS